MCVGKINMPRRKSAGNSAAPLSRRSSARIAAVQATKPASPSPSKRNTPKRGPKKTAEEKPVEGSIDSDEEIQLNGTEDTHASPISEVIQEPEEVEPPTKKAKSDEDRSVHTTPVKDVTRSSVEPAVPDKSHNSTPEKVDEQAALPTKTDVADFEMIDKSTVPPRDSDEVKAAISAQGEDGGLLVNFVQVVKDDLPAEASESKDVDSVFVPKESVSGPLSEENKTCANPHADNHPVVPVDVTEVTKPQVNELHPHNGTNHTSVISDGDAAPKVDTEIVKPVQPSVVESAQGDTETIS